MEIPPNEHGFTPPFVRIINDKNESMIWATANGPIPDGYRIQESPEYVEIPVPAGLSLKKKALFCALEPMLRYLNAVRNVAAKLGQQATWDGEFIEAKELITRLEEAGFKTKARQLRTLYDAGKNKEIVESVDAMVEELRRAGDNQPQPPAILDTLVNLKQTLDALAAIGSVEMKNIASDRVETHQAQIESRKEKTKPLLQSVQTHLQQLQRLGFQIPDDWLKSSHATESINSRAVKTVPGAVLVDLKYDLSPLRRLSDFVKNEIWRRQNAPAIKLVDDTADHPSPVISDALRDLRNSGDVFLVEWEQGHTRDLQYLVGGRMEDHGDGQAYLERHRKNYSRLAQLWEDAAKAAINSDLQRAEKIVGTFNCSTNPCKLAARRGGDCMTDLKKKLHGLLLTSGASSATAELRDVPEEFKELSNAIGILQFHFLPNATVSQSFPESVDNAIATIAPLADKFNLDAVPLIRALSEMKQLAREHGQKSLLTEQARPLWDKLEEATVVLYGWRQHFETATAPISSSSPKSTPIETLPSPVNGGRPPWDVPDLPTTLRNVVATFEKHGNEVKAATIKGETGHDPSKLKHDFPTWRWWLDRFLSNPRRSVWRFDGNAPERQTANNPTSKRTSK